MEHENEHIEDHKVFRTYGFVALAILIIFLNWLGVVPDKFTVQLVGICGMGAFASIRYGQTKDAEKVKVALKKQEKVVKAAVLEAVLIEDQEEKEKCAEEKLGSVNGKRVRNRNS